MAKVNVAQWIDESNQLLVNETHKMLRKKCDGDYYVLRSFCANYIARFTATMIKDSLNAKPPTQMTKEQLCDFTEMNFREMKALLQESVAAGVAKAMTEFSG